MTTDDLNQKVQSGQAPEVDTQPSPIDSGEIKIADVKLTRSGHANQAEPSEPLSDADLKLKAAWSETLPQPLESSDTTGVFQQGVKIAQTGQISPEPPPPPPLSPQPPEVNIQASPEELTIPVSAEAETAGLSPSSGEILTPPNQPSFESQAPADFLQPPLTTPAPSPPLATPSQGGTLISSFLKPFLIVAMGIVIIGLGGYFLWSRLEVGRLLPFGNFNRPPQTTEIETTPPETTQLPTPTPSEVGGGRYVSWFVPVPPSLVPASVVNSWPVASLGRISFNYPKGWQLVDSQIIWPNSPALRIIVSKGLKPPLEDPYGDVPINLAMVNSSLTLTALAEQATGGMNIDNLRTERLSVGNFQALKVWGESGGQPLYYLFISVGDDQFVIMILNQKTKDDQLIFEQVANSVRIS